MRSLDNIPGVSMNNRSLKWRVSISVKGRRINLGSFFKKIDAAKARLSAEIEYFVVDLYTDSIAYKYIKSIEPDFWS